MIPLRPGKYPPSVLRKLSERRSSSSIEVVPSEFGGSEVGGSEVGGSEVSLPPMYGSMCRYPIVPPPMPGTPPGTQIPTSLPTLFHTFGSGKLNQESGDTVPNYSFELTDYYVGSGSLASTNQDSFALPNPFSHCGTKILKRKGLRRTPSFSSEKNIGQRVKMTPPQMQDVHYVMPSAPTSQEKEKEYMHQLDPRELEFLKNIERIDFSITQKSNPIINFLRLYVLSEKVRDHWQIESHYADMVEELFSTISGISSRMTRFQLENVILDLCKQVETKILQFAGSGTLATQISF